MFVIKTEDKPTTPNTRGLPNLLTRLPTPARGSLRFLSRWLPIPWNTPCNPTLQSAAWGLIRKADLTEMRLVKPTSGHVCEGFSREWGAELPECGEHYPARWVLGRIKRGEMRMPSVHLSFSPCLPWWIASVIFFYHHDGTESTEQRTTQTSGTVSSNKFFLLQTACARYLSQPQKPDQQKLCHNPLIIKSAICPCPCLSLVIIKLSSRLFLHLLPGLFYALDFQCHGLIIQDFLHRSTQSLLSRIYLTTRLRERPSKLPLFAEWIWVLTPVRYLGAMPASFTC